MLINAFKEGISGLRISDLNTMVFNQLKSLVTTLVPSWRSSNGRSPEPDKHVRQRESGDVTKRYHESTMDEQRKSLTLASAVASTSPLIDLSSQFPKL